MLRPLTLVAFLVLASALVAQKPPLEGLDAYIERAMPQWQTPGLAVAVVKNDKVVYAKGFGIRALGRPEPVDERTSFAIASNSKAFTCACLGMLVDEGKLAWDERILDILPWFALKGAYETKELDVVDLVTHRVGLPTFGGDHLWIGSDKKRREVLMRVRHMEPEAPFRTGFHYQNLLYTAAGEIIPAKTGKTFAEFVKERILDPLGMNDTTTSLRGIRGKDNVATPHEVRGGKLVTMEYDFVDAITPAAGLNSTVSDMAQWMRLQLGNGTFEGKQLISPKVMADVRHSYSTMRVSPGYTRFFGIHFRGYGLGWFLHDYKGRKVISHGGALTGMISETTMIPEEGLGIVVLTNMALNSLPTVITNRIIDRYLEQPDKDYNALYLRFKQSREARTQQEEKQLLESRMEGTKPSLPLEAYTGTFHNPLPGDATVSLKDGKLYFFYNRRHHGYLTHWHLDTFRIVWIDNIMDMDASAFVRFAIGTDGKVKKLHTTWYHDITFDKKDPK